MVQYQQQQQQVSKVGARRTELGKKKKKLIPDLLIPFPLPGRGNQAHFPVSISMPNSRHNNTQHQDHAISPHLYGFHRNTTDFNPHPTLQFGPSHLWEGLDGLSDWWLRIQIPNISTSSRLVGGSTIFNQDLKLILEVYQPVRMVTKTFTSSPQLSAARSLL